MLKQKLVALQFESKLLHIYDSYLIAHLAFKLLLIKRLRKIRTLFVFVFVGDRDLLPSLLY